MIRPPPRSTLFPSPPLFRSSNPGHSATVRSVEAAAPAVGLKTRVYVTAKPEDITTMFTAILRERPDALFVIPDHFLFTQDRKSTRLNSSHSQISYAVFCLKK